MSYERNHYHLGAIYLNVTDRCNLRCRHCWLSPQGFPAAAPDDRKGWAGGLSVERMRDVIGQARPLGLHTIKVTGGEPFLRSDIMGFISLFHEMALNVDIETNGTLIDESLARELKHYDVRNIGVSLDRPVGRAHDLFRGMDGAFSRTTEGIRCLERHGLNTQVIMSLARENAGEIEDLAALAENLGVQSLKINPITPMGRGRVLHREHQTLSTEELIETFRWVREDLQSRLDIPIYFDLPTAFLPISVIMEGNHPECPILNILGIAENGDISFCGIQGLEKDLVMGNINRDRLDTIWLSHPLLEDIRESVPAKMEGICHLCFFKTRCLGGCRACAYHLEKSLTAPHWFCQDAFDKGLFPATRYHHGYDPYRA